MKITRLVRMTAILATSLLMAALVCSCAASATFVDTFDDGYQSWLKWDGIDTYRVDDNPGILKLATAAEAPNTELRITSKDKFTYGVYDIRFKATNDGWNYLYFGFCSRDPWVNPSVMMRLDNTLMACVGDGPGRANWDAFSPNSPVLQAGVWHDLRLIWQPGSIEGIYDGTSLGVTNTYVTSTALPLVMDVINGAGSSQANIFEIDRISVAPVPEPGTLASLVAMGGMFGFALRRKIR